MTAAAHLLRHLAPIPDRAWKVIDDEARQRLIPLLAARRITDWTGESGWQHDRFLIGRTTTLAGPPPGTPAAEGTAGAVLRQRRVMPLVEVKIPFAVPRGEIEDIQRGSSDPMLDDLDRAVREAATIENRAVFHGWPEAGITGMTAASSYPPVPLGEDCLRYPGIVATAVDHMRQAGIEGPYVLAICPERYTKIVETTERGGYPLIEFMSQVLQRGEVIWSPGIDGAVLVTLRGGDFKLDVGQDWAVGYTSHDRDSVSLYLEESLTFWPTEPDASLTFT